VRISIFEYSRIEEVRAHLQLGEFRIMLALDWLGEPGLIFEPLFDDELVLIVPRDHALAADPGEKLRLAELRGHAVIAHAYPRVLARVFEKADLPEELFNREQPVSVNMRNTETVFAFVEQGIGVAFVPQYMVGLLPHCDVVVRRFVETLPLQFGIYRLPGTKYTVAERAVVDLLGKHARPAANR
jgi:DNA-binding transcriptional LysR family regulator